METQAWTTKSLHDSPIGERVTRILSAAIQAVDPSQAVKSALAYQDNTLGFEGQVFDLATIDRIFLIAVGKASLPMTRAVEEILRERVTHGVVLTKYKSPEIALDPSRYQVLVGSHPAPNIHSVQGSQAILDVLTGTRQHDLVIFLISGGGSALLTLPTEDISLADLQTLTGTLLACGATIKQINTLRKHLSRVKGGQLALWAAPAQSIALVLSDVIGDPLDVIASGPTVPDPSTFQEALEILEHYHVSASLPSTILTHLQNGMRGEMPETPKPGDPLFDHVHTGVIGNNYTAARAAADAARGLGFNTTILSSFAQGEARVVGRILAAIARQITTTGEPLPKPACLILGGETTVTLQGEGLGGRNQELALASVPGLASLADTLLIAMATDGDDGPTDAAGAVVSGESLIRAAALGLDPTEFLARNDAYHFFQPLGDLLKPGPTGTNVCDLNFIFSV